MHEMDQLKKTNADLLVALRQVAEAATPGPWSATHWTCHAATTVMRSGTTSAIAETAGFGRDATECAVDAAFIAAANPAAVLSLLDYVAALEAQLADRAPAANAASVSAALEEAAKLALKFTAVPRDLLGPATANMKTLAAVGEKIAAAIRALRPTAADAGGQPTLASTKPGSAEERALIYTALNRHYPRPNTQHTSVMNRHVDQSQAFEAGWAECRAVLEHRAPATSAAGHVVMGGSQIGKTHALAQSILEAMTDMQKSRTSYENVRDVLDAVRHMNRATAKGAAGQGGAA